MIIQEALEKSIGRPLLQTRAGSQKSMVAGLGKGLPNNRIFASFLVMSCPVKLGCDVPKQRRATTGFCQPLVQVMDLGLGNNDRLFC